MLLSSENERGNLPSPFSVCTLISSWLHLVLCTKACSEFSDVKVKAGKPGTIPRDPLDMAAETAVVFVS